MLQEKDEFTSSVTEQATVRACLRAVDIETANEHCVEEPHSCLSSSCAEQVDADPRPTVACMHGALQAFGSASYPPAKKGKRKDRIRSAQATLCSMCTLEVASLSASGVTSTGERL